MPANQYNDSEALTAYIIANYRHLMTPMEGRASLYLLTTAKDQAYGSRSEITERYQRLHGPLPPEAKQLLADGPALFHERIRNRILSEHADKVVLNRCEKCGSLCRTPLACLCPVCNHTWYERRH